MDDPAGWKKYTTPGEFNSTSVYVGMQLSTDNTWNLMEATVEEIATSKPESSAMEPCPTDHPVGSFLNPAFSCKDIPSDNPSGKYWIQTRTGYASRLFCDMEQHMVCRNSTRGWQRVADIDMTDPTQDCPAPFTNVNGLCARRSDGCFSMTIKIPNVEYTKVCGRVKAYQNNAPDGIHGLSIEDAYVDGISLTHGQPRQHVWTFAYASHGSALNQCPCLSGSSTIPNSIVGSDYFCDTGSRHPISNNPTRLYDQDPLWDGEGCAGNDNVCCEFNTPPWFSKTLSAPTGDDIELRMCANGPPSHEDTPFEVVEIYVQ